MSSPFFSGRQRSYCGLAGRGHAANWPVPCIREADQLPHGRLHRVMTTQTQDNMRTASTATVDESLKLSAKFKLKQAAASLEFPDARPVPPWLLLESSCGRERRWAMRCDAAVSSLLHCLAGNGYAIPRHASTLANVRIRQSYAYTCTLLHNHLMQPTLIRGTAGSIW